MNKTKQIKTKCMAKGLESTIESEHNLINTKPSFFSLEKTEIVESNTMMLTLSTYVKIFRVDFNQSEKVTFMAAANCIYHYMVCQTEDCMLSLCFPYFNEQIKQETSLVFYEYGLIFTALSFSSPFTMSAKDHSTINFVN